MNKAARNERVKITANWFNGAAIAALAVGGFGPITSFIAFTSPISPPTLILMVTGWVFASVALHLAARRTLRRIEE